MLYLTYLNVRKSRFYIKVLISKFWTCLGFTTKLLSSANVDWRRPVTRASPLRGPHISGCRVKRKPKITVLLYSFFISTNFLQTLRPLLVNLTIQFVRVKGLYLHKILANMTICLQKLSVFNCGWFRKKQTLFEIHLYDKAIFLTVGSNL